MTTVQFQLPDLGEGITEAELVRWLVKPGQRIELDQEIVEVQTDKALVVLPTPFAGIVQSLNVAEGQIVPVHTALLTIVEDAVPTLMPELTAAATFSNGTTYANGSVSGTIAPRHKHVLATPVARRMARDLGIDLTTIQGSGPAGRIRTADVQQALERKTGANPTLSAARSGEDEEEERLPLHGLRRQIAQHMLRSVQTIPQVTSLIELDASHLMALRNTLQPEAEQQGVKLSYIPFIARALVQALRQYPYVNASLDEQRNEIVLKHVYHLGIATATPDGLLVPVIRHVDRLTILEIAREVQRLSELARERKLAAHELKGSTFTLTNYGSVGGFFTTPLINPGEAAILGVGKIVKRPWVVDDHLEVRQVLPLSFTADHRLIDGELAMRFLNTLVALLEEPTRMMLTMR